MKTDGLKKKADFLKFQLEQQPIEDTLLSVDAGLQEVVCTLNYCFYDVVFPIVIICSEMKTCKVNPIQRYNLIFFFCKQLLSASQYVFLPEWENYTKAEFMLVTSHFASLVL